MVWHIGGLLAVELKALRGLLHHHLCLMGVIECIVCSLDMIGVYWLNDIGWCATLIKTYRVKINFHFARDGIDASIHRSAYVLLHKSFIAMIKFHLLYKSWMYGQMLRGEIPNVLFGIPIAQQASVAVRKILQRWQHVHIITVIRVGETKVEMEVK